MTEEKLKVMADIDIHAVDEDTIASFEESISLKGKTPVQTLNRFFNKGSIFPQKGRLHREDQLCQQRHEPVGGGRSYAIV